MERKNSSLFRYGLAIAAALLPAYEYIFPEREARGIESRVTEVAKSEIGEGILGDFSPISGQIRIREDIPSQDKHFAYHHEIAHGLGYDGSPHGEYQADVYAAAKTGNPNMIRGPFYKPPIAEQQKKYISV